MRWLFFSRDVRGGLGERRLFRVVLADLAKESPEYVKPIVSLVPEYGRWDDLWCLLDTPLRDDVVALVSSQLENDQRDTQSHKSISLLAKWMPRCKTSSDRTRHYATILRNGLKMTEREYQHTLSALTKYLGVVEQKMSARVWDGINYEAVPSRANLIYNDAFLRHDEDRRREFLDRVKSGEAKINAGTLFPHDIVSKYRGGRHGIDDTLEALWKNLPNTINGCENTIVVADGSGSMTSGIGKSGVTALDVANALAIYFAERSSGQFKDQYITFSEHPQLVDLSKGKNLREKINIALRHCEVANTNVEAVFDLILRTAVLFNVFEIPFSCNKFPMKQLQLAPCPLDPVPAPIDFDLSCFGQGEPGLAPAERLGQGNDFTLALVHPDPQGFKPPNNFMAQLLQPFHIWQNDIIIIHIMTGAMNPGLTFDPVVHGTWKGNHFLLGRLHTQRHPPPRRGTRGMLDHPVSDFTQFRV